jgi:hypothetical protein
MHTQDQNEWITTHIPHRVRAAIARLDMKNSLLHVQALVDPHPMTIEGKIYWRCATDSIWEGRLAATRWLIGFVGIKRDDKGNPAVYGGGRKGVCHSDVRIDDFDGGKLLNHLTKEGRLLADVWKGCTQASSHATNASNHPPVSENVLTEALTIIIDHLQNTIYQKAGKEVRAYVLEPVPTQ